MKHWTDFSKKELLELPKRQWNKVSEYDFVLLVNTNKKHDSGYNYFAVIGFANNAPEIAGYMDDFRLAHGFLLNPHKISFAIDCSMKGVFRIHSNTKIIVSDNTPTTFFDFKPKD